MQRGYCFYTSKCSCNENRFAIIDNHKILNCTLNFLKLNFYHFRTAILVGHMTSSKLSICYNLVRSQEELRKMNTVIIAKVLFQIARFILYLDSFCHQYYTRC